MDEFGYSDTLGAFIRGIPAVFQQLEVFARSYHEMDLYAEFYQRSRSDPSLNADFIDPVYLRGYEYVSSGIHELRHFHDALLCWPLFESFLLRNKRTMALLQMAQHMRISAADLPVTLQSARKLVSPEGMVHLDYLESITASYDARLGHLFVEKIVDGRRITLSTLLEANAVLTELANAVHAHGVKESEAYYEQRTKRLGAAYLDALDVLKRFGLPYSEWLELAHLVFTASLCDDTDPVGVFDALVRLSAGRADRLRVLAVAAIAGLFASEKQHELRVSRMRLETGNGDVIDSFNDLGVFGELASLPRTLFTMRTSLVQTFAGDWGFNLGKYFEDQHLTPFPLTVFFPIDRLDDQRSVLTYESLMREGKWHVLAGKKNEAGTEYTVVYAAIVPTLRQPSDISLAATDLTLFGYYAWRRCFERPRPESKPVWGEMIEGIYEQLFDRMFLRKAL